MTSSVHKLDDEQWMSYKNFIEHYYIGENRTLDWIREELVKRCSFNAR